MPDLSDHLYPVGLSRAAAWAKLSAQISNIEVPGLTIKDVAPTLSDGPRLPFNVHAAVGRRNDQPTICITDYRLGGLTMTAEQALTLARWILDTFGDKA